jgi:hypothetical protein
MKIRYILLFFTALTITAFGQNTHLSQLEVYLQKQKDHVVADSIRHIFAVVSKDASDSYRYEYHKDGTDTMKYELAFRYDNDSEGQASIREVARFLCSGTNGRYYHGGKDKVTNSEMKAVEIHPIIISKQPRTIASGKANSRLQQLEDYLLSRGLKKVSKYKSNTSKTKVRHYWSGQFTADVSKATLDSIRTTFTQLSKEALESHMYENHKNGTDTIEYSWTFTDGNETATFSYKKNSDGLKDAVYKHIYDEHRDSPSEAVAKAIAAKQWRIDINSMNTMRYGARTVTPDFYLELRGDTLHSYLPYLGQAQVSPKFSPSIGLNFETQVLRYKQSMPKSKKYTQIDIDVRTREDSYHYMIQFYDTGGATIYVRSLNRDPISFDGNLITSD